MRGIQAFSRRSFGVRRMYFPLGPPKSIDPHSSLMDDLPAASLIRPQTVNESFTPFATCSEKGISSEAVPVYE